MEGKVSVIDSTQRFEWEVTKEAFDSCEFPQKLISPVYSVHVGKEESKWQMIMWPKGRTGLEGRVIICLFLRPVNVKYTVQWVLASKTLNEFSRDCVEDLYANKGNMEVGGKLIKKVFDGNGTLVERAIEIRFTRDIFNKMVNLPQNKFTLVATLVLYVEGENYIHHREMSRNFMANHRSMADLDMFSDFTIICGNKQFKCHRNVLASMSSIFKTMLTNERFIESKNNMVEILDSSPDIVETMLNFMSNGIISKNIESKAFELIDLAEKYDLQDLKKACERSLANNITVENVVETLIIIDQYVPKSENRQKIVDFIKSNATEVTKVKDWTKFVQNYPNLVTEVFLAMAEANQKMAAELAAKP